LMKVTILRLKRRKDQFIRKIWKPSTNTSTSLVVTIPKNCLRKLGWALNTEVEIVLVDDSIQIRRAEPNGRAE